MPKRLPIRAAALGLCFVSAATRPAHGEEADGRSAWTIHIANDNCPDMTWGFSEAETRKALAEIVRAHLDEMARTDSQPPESRDRYNMAVTQEALCFLQRYPERRDELFRRIREGRVFVSPFLCNSLWGFQSVEGAIRTLYPARRLERDVGVRFDVAHHIECPSLPWGVATILEGCGVRWLSVPFLDYDSSFSGLRNPPLFQLEGPDGSRIRVVLDAWASRKASYTQGSYLLRDLSRVSGEWIPHYRSLGDAYPIRDVLASGTHGDLNPRSGAQARGFAESIARHNEGQGPRLVNSTFAMFADAVDEAEAASPFLTTLRGCFGHSWDLWPLCAAGNVARMREGERAFLLAEALLSVAILSEASAGRPPPSRDLAAETAADRERAEWCLAMLSDHAWNGTDDTNRRHNVAIRKGWGEELALLAGSLERRGWKAMGLLPSADRIVLFNGSSVPRRDVVWLELGSVEEPRAPGGVPWQLVEEEGHRRLAFLAPSLPGFAVAEVELKPVDSSLPVAAAADGTTLRAGHLRVAVDPRTGGISGLSSAAVDRQMVAGGERALAQLVLADDAEHRLEGVRTAVEAEGPVLARVRIEGRLADAEVIERVTVYAELDRIDVDLRIRKPPSSKREKLLQFFPILGPEAVLRVQTAGAVVRPRPAPEGDLLPGADPTRMAVQGFLDLSVPGGPGLTVAPLDAFVLRLDQGAPALELVGNDQNHREIRHDQYGETEFRFRCALRVHAGDYDGPGAFAWSRSVAAPFAARPGRLPEGRRPAAVRLDPERAIATCLKPADRASGGVVLRLWETSGRSGPLGIEVPGIAGGARFWRTDLLERDGEELPLRNGMVLLDLRGLGMGALRIRP